MFSQFLILANLVLHSSCSERGHRARVAALCPERTGAAPCAVEAQRVALSYAPSGWSWPRRGRCCSIGRRRRRRLRDFCDHHPLRIYRAGRVLFSAFSTTARLSGLGVIPVENLITNRSREEWLTSEGIRQPHQSPEDKLVRVQHS